MEVGCLRHSGASTTGSHLLDEDCSHGWQILATEAWAPLQKGRQAPVERGSEERGMFEKVLPCKTAGTVNAITVKAANTRLNPGAHGVLVHAHIKTNLTTKGKQVLFIINSVKLHLTASKYTLGSLRSLIYSSEWINIYTVQLLSHGYQKAEGVGVNQGWVVQSLIKLTQG